MKYICDNCEKYPCSANERKLMLSCPAFYPKTKPMTNADRIRAMTDEELAGFFEGYVDCVYCPRHLDNERCMNDDGSCFHAWVNWLKQEVSDAEP